MRKLIMLAVAVVALGSTGTMAQEMRQDRQAPVQGSAESADQANAQSQPDQGTEQALASPAAEPKAYPVCSRAVQDECVNPREAGRGYGNRPLGYWPGRPASEMR